MKFEELSEEAQERALDNLREPDYEWWDDFEFFTTLCETLSVAIETHTSVWTGKDKKEHHREHPHILCHPLPADLGYHSPKPTYEGQEPISSEPCEYLDGKTCYYDGSGLNAQRIYDVLVKDGSDAVWTELEIYYTQIFGELK